MLNENRIRRSPNLTLANIIWLYWQKSCWYCLFATVSKYLLTKRPSSSCSLVGWVFTIYWILIPVGNVLSYEVLATPPYLAIISLTLCLLISWGLIVPYNSFLTNVSGKKNQGRLTSSAKFIFFIYLKFKLLVSVFICLCSKLIGINLENYQNTLRLLRATSFLLYYNNL